MNESIIVVPGKPGEVFTCITDESRPDPSHAWARAASHVMRDLGFPFLTRLQVHTICSDIAKAIGRPPKKAPVTWTWGWGKGWPGDAARR